MSGNSWLGDFGAWLCDKFYARRATFVERVSFNMYVELMGDVLRGECPNYGRDREEWLKSQQEEEGK